MKHVVIMPQAEQDLRLINNYILRDNPRAASRFIARIKRACYSLSNVPFRGTARDDIQPGVRQIVEHKYRIIYRVTTDAVQILRVVHGARDFRKL
ncbi:type II toxin-antitoxin system RelE/ParE family toxin [bacterium]|nr:type II toxin-antitoxin system RelE/ParE family toxin [bacterium]